MARLTPCVPPCNPPSTVQLVEIVEEKGGAASKLELHCTYFCATSAFGASVCSVLFACGLLGGAPVVQPLVTPAAHEVMLGLASPCSPLVQGKLILDAIALFWARRVSAAAARRLANCVQRAAEHSGYSMP